MAIDADNPLHFRFTAAAQSLFVHWITELETKVRDKDLHPALASHLSKYRSLMPALAALFALADGECADVSLDHARQAAAFCEYLESHARRIYSCVITPQLRAACELVEKIKGRKVGAEGVFSCRDIYIKGWTGLDTPGAVKGAAEILLDAGWLREMPPDTGTVGGRPSQRYAINPHVWRVAQ